MSRTLARSENGMELTDVVGRRVRILRCKAKMNQRELAMRAHLHKTHLQRIESGQTNPTLSTLVKLSSALNVPIEFLVKGGTRYPAELDRLMTLLRDKKSIQIELVYDLAQLVTQPARGKRNAGAGT